MSWFESVSPKVDSSTSAKPFNPEQASLAQLGAFSPLWMLFFGASAAGMAMWSMTRWMRLATPERMSEPVVRLRLVKSEPEAPAELPAAEIAVPVVIKPDTGSAPKAASEPQAEAPAPKAPATRTAPAAPEAKAAEPPAKVAAPQPEPKRAAAPKPAPEAKAALAEPAKPAPAPTAVKPAAPAAKPAAASAKAARAPVARPAARAKAAAPKPATRRGPPRKS